jgi:hypothetical protein
MDRPTLPRRWPIRPALLVALSLLLLRTLARAPVEVRSRIDATGQELSSWLWQSRWTWALAALLTVAALVIPTAWRRWHEQAHRVLPAISIFAMLVTLLNLAIFSHPGTALLALGIVAAVGLVAVLVLVVPRRLAPPVPEANLPPPNKHRERLEIADARTKLQNDVRTTILQAIAGLAVLVTAVLGFQQLTQDRQQTAITRDLTLSGQASERFTEAIDQLGSERGEVRLGGIFTLERIAKQAPEIGLDNRLSVIEVLVTYLHRRIPRGLGPPAPQWKTLASARPRPRPR